jgi:hypothetical protein
LTRASGILTRAIKGGKRWLARAFIQRARTALSAFRSCATR